MFFLMVVALFKKGITDNANFNSVDDALIGTKPVTPTKIPNRLKAT